MSDDLVKKLRDSTQWYHGDCELKMQASDRIEELEADLATAIYALTIADEWLRDLDMYAHPDYHLAPKLQAVRDTLEVLTADKPTT